MTSDIVIRAPEIAVPSLADATDAVRILFQSVAIVELRDLGITREPGQKKFTIFGCLRSRVFAPICLARLGRSEGGNR
jgi:hypothetical protein